MGHCLDRNKHRNAIHWHPSRLQSHRGIPLIERIQCHDGVAIETKVRMHSASGYPLWLGCFWCQLFREWDIQSQPVKARLQAEIIVSFRAMAGVNLYHPHYWYFLPRTMINESCPAVESNTNAGRVAPFGEVSAKPWGNWNIAVRTSIRVDISLYIGQQDFINTIVKLSTEIGVACEYLFLYDLYKINPIANRASRAPLFNGADTRNKTNRSSISLYRRSKQP